MVAPKAYAIGNLPQFKIKMDMNKSLERCLLMTFFEKYNIPNPRQNSRQQQQASIQNNQPQGVFAPFPNDGG